MKQTLGGNAFKLVMPGKLVGWVISNAIFQLHKGNIKMQIKMNSVARMTLQEFAEQHNLVMEINERDTNEFPELPRYYASFEGCEIKRDGVLIGAFGNGETPEDAMEDYTKQISNNALVFFIPGKDRFELKAPILRFVVDNN